MRVLFSLKKQRFVAIVWLCMLSCAWCAEHQCPDYVIMRVPHMIIRPYEGLNDCCARYSLRKKSRYLDHFVFEQGHGRDCVRVSDAVQHVIITAPYLPPDEFGTVLQLRVCCACGHEDSAYSGTVSLGAHDASQDCLTIKTPQDRGREEQKSYVSKSNAGVLQNFSYFHTDLQFVSMKRFLRQYTDGTKFFVRIDFSFGGEKAIELVWGRCRVEQAYLGLQCSRYALQCPPCQHCALKEVA